MGTVLQRVKFCEDFEALPGTFRINELTLVESLDRVFRLAVERVTDKAQCGNDRVVIETL